MEFRERMHCEVLVCAVERGTEVFIPDGRFVLKAKDRVSIVATPQNAAFSEDWPDHTSCQGCDAHRRWKACFYLAKMLLETGIQVKIIEQRKERCEELSGCFPKAMIINETEQIRRRWWKRAWNVQAVL